MRWDALAVAVAVEISQCDVIAALFSYHVVFQCCKGLLNDWQWCKWIRKPVNSNNLKAEMNVVCCDRSAFVWFANLVRLYQVYKEVWIAWDRMWLTRLDTNSKPIYTVIRKKGCSTLVIITLENVDRFL